VACLGAAPFGVSAIALRTGTLSWDQSLFRIQRGPGGRRIGPDAVSHLFWPAAIIAVVLLAVIYVAARNRSVLPVAARSGSLPFAPRSPDATPRTCG